MTSSQPGAGFKSINYRLGNLNTTSKNGALNMGANTWTSTPQLDRQGEAVYICSQSLSSHTGVLPSGVKSAICRVPVAEYGFSTEYQAQSLARFTEVGGLSLKTLRFSVRDQHGNLVPMGDGNWNAQLTLGFPS